MTEDVTKQEDAPRPVGAPFTLEELEELNRRSATNCPACRSRRKREAAITQAAGRIVEILKAHGLSPVEAWEVLGTAGSFYTLERTNR